MHNPPWTVPVNRREVLKYGLGSALALGSAPFLSGCNLRGYRGPARHVILISLDTTRPDHLGCYGNEWIQTPSLDALARESILFTDHLTPATTTLASHASLFTGLYPHSHGVPRNGFTLDPANVTLARILKDAGFTTAGFLGSFALDSRFGIASGFDVFDERFDTMVGQEGADQNQRRAPAVTQAVIEYLEGNGVPRHLFLFAHYFDPHQPYAPTEEFRGLYPGETRYGLGDPLRGEASENPRARNWCRSSAGATRGRSRAWTTASPVSWSISTPSGSWTRRS